MDIPRRDTNDVIAVPIEIFHIIMKFMDRRTRAELRLCSHRMRKLASPLVFDKLRIEIARGSPTEYSIACFKLLWLRNYATRSVSIGAGIGPCHNLRPLVRSASIVRFNYDADYIRQLLISCPNLSCVCLTARFSHGVVCLGILFGSEQIESLEIQFYPALYAGMRRLPELSFTRHLSLLSFHNGSLVRPKALLNFMRHLCRHTRFAQLISISFEFNLSFTQYGYSPARRMAHASRVHCRDPICQVCPPMPTVQHISVTVPSTFEYPIAYFVHVLSYLALKFPDAQSLNIHQHNYPDANSNVPKTLPESRPLDPPHQFWPQIATIDIWHSTHAAIFHALEYFDIVGPRATSNVQVNIHNPPSST